MHAYKTHSASPILITEQFIEDPFQKPVESERATEREKGGRGKRREGDMFTVSRSNTHIRN